MQTKVVENLAHTLVEQKAVTFSFFDLSRPGARATVTVRIADEWDALDDEAEGNPQCVVGEDFVIGHPRANSAVIETTLRFENRYSAGSAVLEASKKLAGQ